MIAKNKNTVHSRIYNVYNEHIQNTPPKTPQNSHKFESKSGGRLDTITVNSSPPENKGLQRDLKLYENGVIDINTGEIFPFEAPIKKSFSEHRIQRYIIQSAIRDCLPNHRIKICLRHRVIKEDDIKLLKNRETGKCSFGNLMVCGSGWVCPCCGAKITEVRRKGLKSILKCATGCGYKIVMITKTARHFIVDRLKNMNESFSKANDAFYRSKIIKKLQKEIGMVGYVRSHEINYGQEYGWHPHYHELWIFKSDKSYDELCALIKKLCFPVWQNRCVKNGLREPSPLAFHVRDAESAWDYVNKYGDEEKKDEPENSWGAAEELTKNNFKKAKSNSMTFLGLVESYMETGSNFTKSLIKEYSQATYRKRALVYSRGLKDLFEIDERTDEEIAAAKEEHCDILADIEFKQWKLILKYRGIGIIQHLGEVAGIEAVQLYIKSLENKG